MKYWLLTTEFPPFFGGGISTYCHFTTKMFAKQGHAVTVFINDSSVTDIEEKQNEDGVRVIRFNPTYTRSSEYLGHVTNICYEFAHVIKRFIEKEGKPDVIESQEYLGIAYYLLQYRLLGYTWCSDFQVIITMHSPTFLYMEYNHIPLHTYPNYWVCEMERFCMQAADLVISPSQFMLDELRKRFELTNQNVVIIPNPFELTDLSDKRSLAHHRGEIIFYGKLTIQKGAFYLLKYFKELWDNGFDQPLTVIGGQDIVYHPEGKNMGDIIRKKYGRYINSGLLKLENKIPPSQIYERLNQAEVIIVPSANDNLPYVVFEMMAIGNIVLVSKQGGQSEIVENGVDGFIFDHNQPTSFSQQLKHVLSLAPEERSIVSTRAVQKIATNYHSDHIYKRKAEAIRQLLSKKEDRKTVFPFIRNFKIDIAEGRQDPREGLLSVVITYFNSGAYIDDAVRSIQDSDYKNFEIIIVDDGSNDPASTKKLEEYKNQPNILILHKNNQGLADTRNKGAAAAKGEYLAFLDADDKVSPLYYSKAIKVLKQYNNIHYVGAWTKYFEGSNAIWPTFNPEPPMILYHNMVNSASLVYKRSAFLSAGQNDCYMTSTGFEDYESIISMLTRGYRGVVLPEILFYYRVRSDSMARDINRTKRLIIYEFISQKHKDIYGTFAFEIFNLTNANGPGMYLDNPTLDYDLASKLPFGGKASLKLVRLIKNNRYVGAIAYKLYKFIKK